VRTDVPELAVTAAGAGIRTDAPELEEGAAAEAGLATDAPEAAASVEGVAGDPLADWVAAEGPGSSVRRSTRIASENVSIGRTLVASS
jgi:hypothetical protein